MKKPLVKAFIIGDPISHSLSPKLHGYWLEQFQIDAEYKALNIINKELPRFINHLNSGEFIGGNITIPHKENIMRFCDDISEEASEIGAVNTLIVKDKEIFGTNSDWLGFLINLDKNAKDWDNEAQAKQAIVIGAGGASRAIVYALMRRKLSKIHILNRTKAKAITLSKQMKLHSYEEVKITAHSLDEFNLLAPFASLVVNTSSVGMHGSEFENLNLNRLPKDAIVNDIVYTPINTPLLNDAKNLELKTVDGLGMLLYQAVLGFEAWFGKKPIVDDSLRQYMLSLLGEN